MKIMKKLKISKILIIISFVLFLRCNAVSQQETLYNEYYRPQFHFTYKKGWLSDINGLVYYNGEYHFFSQHCPNGPELVYPDTHWGHAVSNDLVKWKELQPALAPDSLGPVFSGSAVVDWNNSGGFQIGEEKTLVAFYTSAGYIINKEKDGVICLAYSNDRGRTWTKYDKNPIVEAITHFNRDPKVFWYEPERKWVMVITLSGKNFYDGDYRFAFLESKDMKNWKELSRFEMPRGIDCPDMFELPVDGNPNDKRWVLWAGDGTHAIGFFDGNIFIPDGAIHLPLVDWFEDGANGYAAQTFNNLEASSGRRIQISWLRHGKYPGMQFNQQATFPCELTLRTFNEKVLLCRYPIPEIEQLYVKERTMNDVDILPGKDLLKDISGELFDIEMEIDPGTAYLVSFFVGDTHVNYDPLRKNISCNGKSISALSDDGLLRLRMLIDRTSLEIFADQGRTSLTFSLSPIDTKFPLKLLTKGGKAKIKSLRVSELASIHSD
jgi:fructan beta-fructosidase